MKKILFCMVCVLSSFLLCNKVNAEAFVYERSSVNNIDFDGGRSNQITFNYVFTDMEMTKPVYLIGTHYYLTDRNNYTKYNENDYSKLTNEQKELIGRYIKYGYGYKDHSDMKWYVATQICILKVAHPEYPDIKLVDLWGTVVDTSYDSYIESLELLVKYPSSDDVIVDENNSIKINYINDMYSINTDLNYEISNNSLIANNIFKNTSLEIKDINDTRFSESVSYLVGYTNNDLVVSGTYNTKYEKTINIKLNKVNVNFSFDIESNYYSIDSDSSSICYDLYKDNELVKTICNNDEEKNIELEPGEYYYIQSNSGIGYENDTDKHYIDVTTSGDNTFVIKVFQIHNTFKIKHVYCVDNVCEPFKNVKYLIKNGNDEVIDTAISNDNGEFTYEVGYGNYKVEQIRFITGSTESAPITFKIENSDDVYLYRLKNKYLWEDIVVDYKKEDDLEEETGNKDNQLLITSNKNEVDQNIIDDNEDNNDNNTIIIKKDVIENNDSENVIVENNDGDSKYESILENEYVDLTIENPDTSTNKHIDKLIKYLVYSFIFIQLQMRALKKK